MQRLFAGWRAVADWASGVLVACCGLLCLVGAVGLWRQGGPTWVAALFATVGAALLVGNWLQRRETIG